MSIWNRISFYHLNKGLFLLFCLDYNDASSGPDFPGLSFILFKLFLSFYIFEASPEVLLLTFFKNEIRQESIESFEPLLQFYLHRHYEFLEENPSMAPAAISMAVSVAITEREGKNHSPSVPNCKKYNNNESTIWIPIFEGVIQSISCKRIAKKDLFIRSIFPPYFFSFYIVSVIFIDFWFSRIIIPKK